MSMALTPNEENRIYPALILIDGQYIVRVPDSHGNIIEKFVSPKHVRQAFTQEPIDSGWLSPNVVRWGMSGHGDWVVMFIPPQVHKLPFIGEDPDNPKNIIEYSIPLPALIFIGNGSQYSVWAVKTKTFDPSSLVYRAPLPNSNIYGEICFGPTKPPRANGHSVTEAWRVFSNTAFSNHTVDGKCKSQSKDVRVLLRELSRTEQLDFPLNELVPLIDEKHVTVDALALKLFSGK